MSAGRVGPTVSSGYANLADAFFVRVGVAPQQRRRIEPQLALVPVFGSSGLASHGTATGVVNRELGAAGRLPCILYRLVIADHVVLREYFTGHISSL